MRPWLVLIVVAVLGILGGVVRAAQRSGGRDREHERELRERVLRLVLAELRRDGGYRRPQVFFGFGGPELVVARELRGPGYASALLVERPSRACRRAVREHGLAAILERHASSDEAGAARAGRRHLYRQGALARERADLSREPLPPLESRAQDALPGPPSSPSGP